jgi:thiol-disulfide isomerase/thioredoxin
MKTIISLMLVLMSLVACTQQPALPATELPATDQSVKTAFEALNGQTAANGQPYIEVHIPEDSLFVPINEEDALQLLESGTGVLIFEFPECPWCRNMMPVVDEAAKEMALSKLYTFNIREERDQITLGDDGELVVVNEGTEFYRKVLDLLGESASVYEGLNDESIRRIYAPTVFVIVDGEVVSSHVSTIDSQTDPMVPLTVAQHQELLDIYKGMFEVISPVCLPDDAC